MRDHPRRRHTLDVASLNGHSEGRQVKSLVVLPSYNEATNIIALIQQLVTRPELHVCVVDDSSPDGTSALVADWLAEQEKLHQRIHLITRAKKDGRGGAVRDGFAWGLASGAGFEAYVEMDCDFSHDPADIPTGLKLLDEGNDVVLGARYPDGTIIDWPVARRVFSRFANGLARVAIDRSIHDYTNGFRFYTESAAGSLASSPQEHTGYIYLTESLSILIREGRTIGAFPIVFRNRRRGHSNTTPREIANALIGLFRIAWRHRRQS
jgi:dolichol-phosphate mannosyltransferase